MTLYSRIHVDNSKLKINANTIIIKTIFTRDFRMK